MLFDKKINYLTEALRAKSTSLGGYTGQSTISDEEAKNAYDSFLKTKDPSVLLAVLTYAQHNPDKHIKINGKWHMAKELKDIVKKRFFTEGSKDYINFPKDDYGKIVAGNILKRVIFNKDKTGNFLYPVLHRKPDDWRKIIDIVVGTQAASIRQEGDTTDFEFYYFATPKGENGPVKKGNSDYRNSDQRVSITRLVPFEYRNKYQAYTSTGEPITYQDLMIDENARGPKKEKLGRKVEDFLNKIESAQAQQHFK
jgi:hypothetical protein